MYTSEQNPIIQSVRHHIKRWDGIHRNKAAFWHDCARYLTSGSLASGVAITGAHKDHARKVFLKLSALNR